MRRLRARRSSNAFRSPVSPRWPRSNGYSLGMAVRGSAGLLVLAAVLLAALAPASSGGTASTHQRSPFRGLGTWVSIYAPAEWANPEAAVAAMARHGVRTLYLETGNYSHRASVFRPADAGRFIDAAHAAG